MKLIKRLLLVVFTLLLLLIGAAVAIPYIYKDRMLDATKQAINQSVNAEVDFERVHLSLFHSFPKLFFEVENYSVTGKAPFEGQILASGASIGLELDLFSILFGSESMQINSIELDQPFVNVQVLKSGLANYDIALSTEEDTITSTETIDYGDFVVELESYRINDAHLIYNDRSLDTYLELQGLNHAGSGQFTVDVYDLDTETAIESFTAKYGGITYLKNAQTSLDALFNIDQGNSKYTLKDNILRVNALQLNAEGFVQLVEEAIAMDLALSSPQNEFKSLLSLIPAAYIQGYEEVEADGTFKVNALVRGNYDGLKGTYPAFKVNLDVENAKVKYPDLPLGIDNIIAKVGVNSPTSDFDDMIVNIPKLRMKVGNNPFEGTFRLSHPISDPDIDTKIDGVINLEEIAKAFPVEGTEALRGIITADVAAKTRMSYVDKGLYDQVDMSGDLLIEELEYKTAGLPAVEIKSADMQFTPQRVNLKDIDLQLGKSDLKAEGAIDNVLAYFSPEKTMTGKLMVRSNYFNADEWLVEDTSSTAATSSSSTASSSVEYEIFDRFDFELDAEAREIDYDVYKLKNTVAVGQLSPSRMNIKRFSSEIGKSDLAGSGKITNVFDYVFEGETLGGDLQFNSAYLDLNQFMVTTEESSSSSSETSTAEPIEAIMVPANMDITVDTKIDKVLYDNMELRDIRGALVVENEAVVLDDVKAKALGGVINMSGGYDTKDHSAPAFNIKYDLQQIDFQETFRTLNTFKALAPIGEFLEGEFTTSLIMDGTLGQDLMPNLMALNAQGYLQTLNASITNFKPLQAVGNALDVEEFKEKLKIKGTKNWFEIKDGAVEVKEFDYDVSDIAMKISGSHSLTQEMAYQIKARIPRAYIESSGIGQAATSGLDALTAQANKLGLDLKKSEFVNVMINLTGSIADPKVKFRLLGTDGEATVADAAKDQVKEELNAQKEKLQEQAEEEVDALKEEAEAKAKEELDKARAEAEAKLQEEKEKLSAELGKEVEDKATEVLGDKAKENADKIKEELEKFNPFKKKKKKKDGGG